MKRRKLLSLIPALGLFTPLASQATNLDLQKTDELNKSDTIYFVCSNPKYNLLQVSFNVDWIAKGRKDVIRAAVRRLILEVRCKFGVDIEDLRLRVYRNYDGEHYSGFVTSGVFDISPESVNRLSKALNYI